MDNTFENILVMKYKFENYLKGSCELSYNYHFSFKYFHGRVLIKKSIYSQSGKAVTSINGFID